VASRVHFMLDVTGYCGPGAYPSRSCRLSTLASPVLEKGSKPDSVA
jgi:hypothetical protein